MIRVRIVAGFGLLLTIAVALSQPVLAEEAGSSAAGTEQPAEGNQAVKLAKQLANPVAALISLPFQLNYDTNIGPEDKGDRLTLNIQPVIPISLSEDWNLISRTILPVIWQEDIFPGAGNQSGISDVVQSLFLSPQAPTSGGWIWGAGPVFLFPTGTDDLLTTDKWGVGPTAVALRQQGPWTYGGLVNHIWSVAGPSARSDVNATFLQPFLGYTTKTAITITALTESTYDWEAEEWAVPLILVANKVTSLGGQMFSFGGGVRYWAASADNGPEGWGARLVFTLMFPK